MNIEVKGTKSSLRGSAKQSCFFISNFLILLALLIVYGFSYQNSGVLNPDRKHVDSLIAFNETKGKVFYDTAKYDSAIKYFNTAAALLDSLFKKDKNPTDEIDRQVTYCNISLCYFKKKKYDKGFENMEESYNYLSSDIPLRVKILVLVQCTIAEDYLIWNNIRRSEENFDIAMNNLDHNKLIRNIDFRYAINKYTYQGLCERLAGLRFQIKDTNVKFREHTYCK